MYSCIFFWDGEGGQYGKAAELYALCFRGVDFSAFHPLVVKGLMNSNSDVLGC